MWQYFNSPMMSWGGDQLLGAPWAYILLLLLVWSLAWKGLALWHAARRGEVYWFVALLIANTVGILEILYLYAFGGKEEKSVSANTTPSTPRQ